jgi:hypothetical protein
MGLDTKIYWLTDRQWQCNFDLGLLIWVSKMIEKRWQGDSWQLQQRFRLRAPELAVGSCSREFDRELRSWQLAAAAENSIDSSGVGSWQLQQRIRLTAPELAVGRWWRNLASLVKKSVGVLQYSDIWSVQLQWECYKSRVNIRCQGTPSGGYNRLSTLVCV